MCIANFIFIWRQIYNCIYITEATLNPGGQSGVGGTGGNVCTFYMPVTTAAFKCKRQKRQKSFFPFIFNAGTAGVTKIKKKKGVEGGAWGALVLSAKVDTTRSQEKKKPKRKQTKTHLLTLCATRLHSSANPPLAASLSCVTANRRRAPSDGVFPVAVCATKLCEPPALTRTHVQ